MSDPTDYHRKLADKLAEIAIRAFMDWQDTDRDEDWPESVVPDVAAVLASEQVVSHEQHEKAIYAFEDRTFEWAAVATELAALREAMEASLKSTSLDVALDTINDALRSTGDSDE